MNCWHGEYEDNSKVIKYFPDIIINSKLIKEYFKKYQRVDKGGDYYDTYNWVIDPDFKNSKIKYYNIKNIIFLSSGSVKKQSYIEFITAIKTDKKVQEWYYNKFKKIIIKND